MEGYITKQIDELHGKSTGLKNRIEEQQTLVGDTALQDYQFEVLRNMIQRR